MNLIQRFHKKFVDVDDRSPSAYMSVKTALDLTEKGQDEETDIVIQECEDWIATFDPKIEDEFGKDNQIQKEQKKRQAEQKAKKKALEQIIKKEMDDSGISDELKKEKDKIDKE